MTIFDAMQCRHSVRAYLDKPIPPEVAAELNREIAACNLSGNLHIQLVTNESRAFSGLLPHYGSFRGVRNYIALVGKSADDLEERIGYYGERLVLKAQMLGLNTCWVALTMRKSVAKAQCQMEPDEKLVCVLALGYGEHPGVPHKSRPMDALCQAGEHPDWFRRGMEAAMLAPTAVNQQKFYFTRNGNQVSVKATGGFYAKVDLGIVKYHFELGAGTDSFTWGP